MSHAGYTYIFDLRRNDWFASIECKPKYRRLPGDGMLH